MELGFDNQYMPAEHSQLVQSVVPGSPAERAGMKPGDRIIRINGVPLEEDTLIRVWSQHKPGDSVELAIQRPGVSDPIVLRGTFRASGSASAEAGVVQHVGQGILRLYPFAFLTVGLAVLFLRLEDPNAWLLALMFGGFIAIPGFANSFLGVPPSLRPLAIAYRAIFDNMVPALFYFFFAVFPTQSPLDRRVPWLKWLALVLGLALALPLGVALMLPASGGTEPNRVAGFGWLTSKYAHFLILSFNYGMVALGFVSLTWNALTVGSSEARRKIRVILVGTLVGVVPATLALGANDFVGFHIGLWLGVTLTVLLWLFPLSFAYAVVKHRVLEIPVLLRRSARYLLVQRGFVILLAMLSIGMTWAFALIFARYLQPLTAAAAPGGIALGDSLRNRLTLDRNAGPQRCGWADRPGFLSQCLRRADHFGGPGRENSHGDGSATAGGIARVPSQSSTATQLFGGLFRDQSRSAFSSEWRRPAGAHNYFCHRTHVSRSSAARSALGSFSWGPG